MALAAPALVLWNPSLASGPCRDASNEGRHAEVMRAGAIVVQREAHQQWDCCRQACASRARVACLLGGGGKRVRELFSVAEIHAPPRELCFLFGPNPNLTVGLKAQLRMQRRRSCAQKVQQPPMQIYHLRKEDLMQDAARKALEAALGEKKDAFSKWDEEIKKREESGGGGKGRGRGWGSGGGGGGGGSGGDANFDGLPANRSDSWDDTKQMILAFVGLASLYLVLTQGKSMLAVSVNSALFVLRGFKKSGSSTSSRLQPALGRPIGDGPGPAESSVMNKWGKD